jgi:hypothetical protein
MLLNYDVLAVDHSGVEAAVVRGTQVDANLAKHFSERKRPGLSALSTPVLQMFMPSLTWKPNNEDLPSFVIAP